MWLMASNFPARLNLVLRQQQTRLEIRNPLDKSDTLECLIEGLEALHVPAHRFQPPIS